MAIETAKKVISPVKLVHVVLRTSPEAFYKTFFGGHAFYENAMFSFTYDYEHHRIAVAALLGLKPKVRHLGPRTHRLHTCQPR